MKREAARTHTHLPHPHSWQSGIQLKEYYFNRHWSLLQVHSSVKLQIAATFCISNLIWNQDDGQYSICTQVFICHRNKEQNRRRWAVLLPSSAVPYSQLPSTREPDSDAYYLVTVGTICVDQRSPPPETIRKCVWCLSTAMLSMLRRVGAMDALSELKFARFLGRF